MVAGWARSRQDGSSSASRSSTSHGRAGVGSTSASTPAIGKPSRSYIAATSGVEQATTVSAGVSSRPVAAATVLTVTSANRSVGAVSKIGTTTERIPASTLNRSIAASRRWYGTGLRRVFSWLAEVTAQTTVAPAARSAGPPAPAASPLPVGSAGSSA